MNLVVTDLVQQNDVTSFSAPKFRHQVMQALAYVRRDRTTAEWADRIAHVVQSIKGPAGTIPSGFRSSEGEKYRCL